MKTLKFKVRLEVAAGSVTAGPPIATVLGPKGVPLGLFAKAINEATSSYDKGSPVRLIMRIYDDKSYDYDILGNSARYHIFKAAGLAKGSVKPGHSIVGSISHDQVTDIAKKTSRTVNMVLGTMRSMGIAMQ